MLPWRQGLWIGLDYCTCWRRTLCQASANARAQRLSTEPVLLEDAQTSCPTPPSVTPLWILQRRRVSALEAAHRSEAFPERSCLKRRLQTRLRDPEQEGRVADRH